MLSLYQSDSKRVLSRSVPTTHSTESDTIAIPPNVGAAVLKKSPKRWRLDHATGAARGQSPKRVRLHVFHDGSGWEGNRRKLGQQRSVSSDVGEPDLAIGQFDARFGLNEFRMR